MSKWRPSELNCLYVIPDIHGAFDLLEKVLKRILPLRKSDGGQDKIVFLGDYIDRGPDSFKVLDKIINLKEKYGNQIICICGNHELMLLEGLGFLPCDAPESVYGMWMEQGGIQTISSYMREVGIGGDARDLSQSRVKDILPQKHIDFMLNLDGYYEEDEFVFVHGGYDPNKSLYDCTINELAWNRRLFDLVKNHIRNDIPLTWEKPIIITGHNKIGNGLPIVKDQFMMLDCGSPIRLLIAEARSRTAFMANPGKRLVKFELKETIVARKPAFRRV